jgi:hypothetical protein
MIPGLPVANTNIFAMSIIGRTLTPSGPITINDGRQRLPAVPSQVTMPGNVDAASWDVYAQTAVGNAYSLIVVVAGTDMSARRDVVKVGGVVDYPSLGTMVLVPLVGGNVPLYSRANISLFSASVSNRTVTPAGNVQIYDTRTRAPATVSAVTTPGVADGTVYDCYAQIYQDGYRLGLLASGTSVAGRQDVVLVGTVTDYPSRSLCRFVNAAGGSVDSFLRADTTGIHIRNSNPQYGWTTVNFDDQQGAQFLFPNSSAGQQVIYDQYGHVIMNIIGPTPSIVAGPGLGGSGQSWQVYGGDQAGVLTLITGTAPLGGNALLAEVHFAHAFTVPSGSTFAYPNAVVMTAYNNAASLQMGQVYARVYNPNYWQVFSGANPLSASTSFQWNYLVM